MYIFNTTLSMITDENNYVVNTNKVANQRCHLCSLCCYISDTHYITGTYVLCTSLIITYLLKVLKGNKISHFEADFTVEFGRGVRPYFYGM